MLKLCNISKRYGANEALNSVYLEIQAGEIHGLVGENGGGKSTLLNILFGNSSIKVTGGYSGEIYLNGTRVNIQTSGDAIGLGIGMVHQEFVLLKEMTVTENIKVNRETVIPLTGKFLGSSLALIDKSKNRQEVKEILNRLGLAIDPAMKVNVLSVSVKQFIEFAREFSKEDLKVLILDEPTATLGKDDAQKLLTLLRELSLKGVAILFVSHRLQEVVSLCHRVTVLRNGRVVATYDKNQFSIPRIAQDMVGKEVVKVQRQRQTLPQKTIIRFQDFAVEMPGERLINLNLEVYEGEILGVAGLSGHGKLALGNGVMGLFPSSGQVIFEGTPLDTCKTARVVASGICLVPDDRRQAGLLMEQSILNNVIFTAVQRKNRFLRGGILNALRFINKRQAARYTEQIIESLDIRCQNLRQRVKHLSGGNQQKVCLARAIALEPRVLVISEPTRGIDIGAKELILEAILKVNQEFGTTVIVASSELGELKRICDRIAVLYEGKLFGVYPSEADDLQFALAYSGKRLESDEQS